MYPTANVKSNHSKRVALCAAVEHTLLRCPCAGAHWQAPHLQVSHWKTSTMKSYTPLAWKFGLGRSVPGRETWKDAWKLTWKQTWNKPEKQPWTQTWTQTWEQTCKRTWNRTCKADLNANLKSHLKTNEEYICPKQNFQNTIEKTTLANKFGHKLDTHTFWKTNLGTRMTANLKQCNTCRQNNPEHNDCKLHTDESSTEPLRLALSVLSVAVQLVFSASKKQSKARPRNLSGPFKVL